MQGGHHPKLGIDWYLTLLNHIREKYPHINIHGFSPPEFNHFAEVFHMPLREVIAKFKDAGLGSIPGGGGEILVDRRAQPHRAAQVQFSDQWLEVMAVAHELGLKLERHDDVRPRRNCIEERIEHLDRLRAFAGRDRRLHRLHLLDLPTRAHEAARRARGHGEYLRMQALSRIFLDNIDNVQSSWVTQGPKIGQIALKYGANDFGSVMMEENVVSSAGTSFRLAKEQIEELIRDAGYEPRRRDNWYRLVD